MNGSVARHMALWGLALALIPVGVAQASPGLPLDGNLSNWGLDPNTIYGKADPGMSAFNSTQTGVYSWTGDGVDVNNSGYLGVGQAHGGPGYGGQAFDLEGMYAYYNTAPHSNPGLYIAIVTGTPQYGVGDWNNSPPKFMPGDIFLNFGQDTTGLTRGQQPYNLAVTTGAGNAGVAYVPGGNSASTITPSNAWYSRSVYNATNGYGSYDGAALVNTGAATLAQDQSGVQLTYTDIYGSVDGTGKGTNLSIPTGAPTNGNTTFYDYAITSAGNQYDHNVIELYLSSAFLTANGFNFANSTQVSLFWEVTCGNDQGTLLFQTPQGGTPPPVPEPVTMVMLGCLGAGMLGVRRLRRKTS